MANLAYQVTGFAYQGIGQFAYQGSVDLPPGSGGQTGGGDSTRLRKRRGKRNWRYWWEKDEPEEVLVLKPEEAVLDPVTVEALWEERAQLNDYIIEMSVAKVSQRVMDKLAEVSQFTQARIDAEESRQKRIRKKRMLLLGGG